MTTIIDHDNVTPLSTGDQWTPILHGDIYCSPACGGNCKKTEFDRVTAIASTIANALGRGWMPNVSENLGWHFKVTKGNATVSIDEDGQYTAKIHFKLSDTSSHTISNTSDEPRKAVNGVIDELQRRIETLKRTLHSIVPDTIEIEDF